MSEPNVALPAIADPNNLTQLKTPPRVLPIVVVPGTMGTRLSDPTTHMLAWNPLGVGMPTGECAGPFVFDQSRLENVHQPLVPDRWNRHRPWNQFYTVGEALDGFYGMIENFYRTLCINLQSTLAIRLIAHKNILPLVYFAGYDWRQDNSTSADVVNKTINRAFLASGGNKVVIVAHSQGGLVSRTICKKYGEEQIRSIYLIGSPTHGAPKGYEMLKTGSASDASLKFGILKTFFDSDLRDFARKLPSVYQLAPSTAYGSIDPYWLQFTRERTGLYYNIERNSYQPSGKTIETCATESMTLYLDPYIGFADRRQDRSTTISKIAAASIFHRNLTNSDGTPYMHPHSYFVYSFKLPTKMSIAVHYSGATTDAVVTETHSKLEADGDGTVPVESAYPESIRAKFPNFHIEKNIDHGDLPNNASVMNYIMNSIYKWDCVL